MVHAITDGRDTSPTGGAGFLEDLRSGPRSDRGTDRHRRRPLFCHGPRRRWDRNKLGVGCDRARSRQNVATRSPAAAVHAAYAKEPRGDEFLPPLIFSHAERTARARWRCRALFFNFRADRARQLSQTFLDTDFSGFDRERAPEGALRHAHAIRRDIRRPRTSSPRKRLTTSSANVASAAGIDAACASPRRRNTRTSLTSLMAAIEQRFPRRRPQDHSLAESRDLRSATGDERAARSTDVVLASMSRIRPRHPEFRQSRHGRPHRRGASGGEGRGNHRRMRQSYRRAALLALGGKLFITADHGNCEQMRNPDGSPNTAHTTNLVHFIYVGRRCKAVPGRKRHPGGCRADAAFPARLPAPQEMTGHSLVTKENLSSQRARPRYAPATQAARFRSVPTTSTFTGTPLTTLGRTTPSAGGVSTFTFRP